MPSLADTDPIPLVLARLRADQRVLDVLNVSQLLPGNISGVKEAPWPCLVVDAGDDQLGSGRAVVTATVRLEVFDSYDSAVGPYRLRRALLTAVESLLDLPELHTPGEPVVTLVEPSGSVSKLTFTTGQTRYSTSVQIRLTAAQIEPATLAE